MDAWSTWKMHDYPAFTSVAVCFQKTFEPIFTEDKIRARNICDVKSIAPSRSRSNAPYIHPKLHKAACGYLANLLVRLIKATIAEYNTHNNIKMCFCTGLNGDEIKTLLDEACDHVDSNISNVNMREIDIEKMDAGVTRSLKKIQNSVLALYKEDLRKMMNLPNHAFECVYRNASMIDVPFSVIEYSKGESITHMTGIFNGTTLSGWP